MKKINILHITDLHLDEIDSPNENLRRAKYKEFIDDLIEKMNSAINSPINLLVCTGDFVNKNKVQNWPHARTILTEFVRKLKIANKDVTICVGNHDIDFNLDKKGQTDDSRKDFKNLENDFCPSSLLKNESFYRLYHNEEQDCYMLSFDSTLGCQGNNIPGTQSDTQIDKVIMDIDEIVPVDKPLIVISHYPMILFSRSQIHLDSDNWVEEHLWKSGTYIAERIYKKRKNSFTFWFFGDGHLPQFWSFNQYHCKLPLFPAHCQLEFSMFLVIKRETD